MKRTSTVVSTVGLMLVYLGVAHAAVTPEEAKQLGTSLTLMGAEKAGSKDGVIPEYTGGLTAAPAGFDKAKGVRPDPFAGEKRLFAIDGKNVDQYADKLTEGSKALLKANTDFRMDVYPTHRTVAMPKAVLDTTVKNATHVKLSDDGLSLSGSNGGIPFPIPKTGNEAIFNHLTRYQGLQVVVPKFSAYNVDRSGRLALSSQGMWTQESPYYETSNAPDPNMLTRAQAVYSGPARRAGEAIMTMESLDAGKSRRAWQYLPGQRRVRLAPDLAYDTPNPSTGGMSTYDDVYLFNGMLDRFDFKLVGKKEIYVPYNTYRFTYHDKPEDAFLPKFINPDLVRWELHRVWVVEAKLKEGKRHIYSRRTFYLDEDSWAILAVDQYDGRGQLWRPGFAYLTVNYDAASISTMASGHYDLISGGYYINVWAGANGIKVSDKVLPNSAWTPDNLAAQGVR